MMPPAPSNLTALAQFVVAVLGVVFLGSVAVLSATGAISGEANSELAFAAIGGLSALVGQASAFLFRAGNGGGGASYLPAYTGPPPAPPSWPTGGGV